MIDFFIESSGTFFVIPEFTEEFVKGELSVFFASTRHKTPSTAAI
jgi:hypothetical protein